MRQKENVMDNSAYPLRDGSCSCMPERIILPEDFTVDFIHLGRKVTLPFNLQHIVIPQEKETMARFESRVQFFIDAHQARTRYGGIPTEDQYDIWRTSVELCDIRSRDEHHNTPYQFWRHVETETQDLAIYTEHWKMWELPNIPPAADILSAFKILLQRQKRRLGWDGFHAWLASMTPPGWTLPKSFRAYSS